MRRAARGRSSAGRTYERAGNKGAVELGGNGGGVRYSADLLPVDYPNLATPLMRTLQTSERPTDPTELWGIDEEDPKLVTSLPSSHTRLTVGEAVLSKVHATWWYVLSERDTDAARCCCC